ncbi:MAG: thioredoxin-dependent thiol peroxidase [Planctomycetota bacterium]
MAEKLLKVGSKAPDFKLTDQDGNEVSLSDFRGQWVVLYFYPKDDTPGCTTEACEFTQLKKDFEDMDVRVVGVSPDSPESHRDFIKKHGLDIELLSDPEHHMLSQYGAWGKKEGKEKEGVNRSTVLIDPEGKVMSNWEKVRAEGHAQEVKEKARDVMRGGSTTRRSPGTTQQG